MQRKPIAFVIPWFGRELKGGAEQQAWQLATRLAVRGHPVEILTTCCRSFLEDWSINHHPKGFTIEDGVTIRRFPVDRRDVLAFDELNKDLLQLDRRQLLPGVPPVETEYGAVWTKENINSRELLDHLKQRACDYEAFIFIPYLYGPTLNGLPLVADKAWLQPCLHDEAYAYLPEVGNSFCAAKGILFNSEGEAELAARLFGPASIGKGYVVGEGVEFEDMEGAEVDLPAPLNQMPFLLCLGRRDRGKGVDFLIGAYLQFRDKHPESRINLVLAGPGQHSYDNRERGVFDLGLVDSVTKAALLKSCRALCQPSTNESFSRVMYEAWYCGKPVVAHGECLATSRAVAECGGGWVAREQSEWCERLQSLAVVPEEELTAAGKRGYEYACENVEWERVLDKYEHALGLKATQTEAPVQKPSPSSVHQLLPSIAFGDAISNEAIAIRQWLLDQGFPSEIFIIYVDEKVADKCKVYRDGMLKPGDGLIYHHSIGSEVTPVAIAHAGPKALIYHNITPAEFAAPYRPQFARLLRQGREDMWGLARHFPVSVGDSQYNADELELFGFMSPGVLPLAINPVHWDELPDVNLMRELQDGRHNLLFVGRYSPNKCQHHLIQAFAHYLDLDPTARLILIGSSAPNDPFVDEMHRAIDAYGLHQHIRLPGHITDAQLQAYYRTAHLFWSMSEHEGFCVPLIEAMWFDVPILAFRSSAIPETLAGSGIMFDDKTDPMHVASRAYELVSNQALREAVILGQRECRKRFLPDNVVPRVRDLLEKMADSQYVH